MGLSGSGGSQQEDVGLAQLQAVALGHGAFLDLDALVMVVDRHAHGALGGLLPNDVLVEEVEDLLGLGQLKRDTGTRLTQLLIDDLVAQLDALVTDVDTRSRDELLDLLLALATEGALEQIHTLSVTCHSFLQIRLRSPHPGATASAYGLNRQVHQGYGGVSSPQYATLGTLLPAFGGFIFTGRTAGAPAGNRQERRGRCHCPTTPPTGGQEDCGEAGALREVSTWSTIP